MSDNADALVGVNTDRGYTMHEHLDEVGVIHMNGRVYDPLIGRFMSADPFIQRSVHAGIRCETFVRCLKANCPNGTTNPDQSTPQPAIRP